MAVRFVANSKEYRYTLRRCSICKTFQECQERIKWSEHCEWLEPARCGCQAFSSENVEAMEEKPSIRHGA